MAHEDQFTATGPAFVNAGFPRAAFSTNRAGADFVHGVNVEGSRCGVFGKSVGQPRKSSRETTVELVGVYGLGDKFGVFGKGTAGGGGAGVRGDGGSARQRGAVRVAPPGVLGHGGFLRDPSNESPGAGVIGVGTGAEDPDARTSAGVGVFGIGATSVPVSLAGCGKSGW